MQTDIKPALNHFAIRLSVNAAVQDVKALINLDPDMDPPDSPALLAQLKSLDKLGRAALLAKDIFGIETTFTNTDEAVIMSQAMIEKALLNDGMVEDTDLLLMAARKRADDFITNPKNKWMFVKPDAIATDTVTEIKQIGGVDTQVAVNSEGKFKKGEKERLGIELYKKYQKEAVDPNDNQAFIRILMKELNMSKAGATTYNYNMKKKMGGVIVAKPKRAK